MTRKKDKEIYIQEAKITTSSDSKEVIKESDEVVALLNTANNKQDLDTNLQHKLPAEVKFRNNTNVQEVTGLQRVDSSSTTINMPGDEPSDTTNNVNNKNVWGSIKDYL
ncbi:MAG: hypothetical protein RCG15_07690 [Candidatus Rickettsia vulgarisii]